MSPMLLRQCWNTFTKKTSVSYPSDMSADSAESHGHDMMFHLHVYALANKLRIPGLKDRATEYFLTVAALHWSDPSFPAAVQLTYSINPPGQGGEALRNIVLGLSAKHAKDLFADPNELSQV